MPKAFAAQPSQWWKASTATVTKQPFAAALPGSQYGAYWDRWARAAASRIITPPAAPAASGQIVNRTATVAETASGTSITGTLPTDRVAGDLVIAQFSMTCTVAQFTGPGGSWVQIVAPTVDNGGLDTVAVYAMFDPPSAPTGTSSAAAGRQTCICQAYGAVDTGTPVDVAAVTTIGTLPLTVTQVTTFTDGARLVSGTAANFSTGTWTFPAGMTPVANHTSGVGRGAGYADEVRATAGPTGTRQWTASTLQASVGYLFALRPAPAGGGPAATVPTFVQPTRRRGAAPTRRGRLLPVVPAVVVSAGPAWVPPATQAVRRRPPTIRRGKFYPAPAPVAAAPPPFAPLLLTSRRRPTSAGYPWTSSARRSRSS